MNLKQQLTEDMKTAMKARDMDKLGVIRFVLSEIKNTEIDHGEQDDAGIQKVISRMVKQTKDAINDFQKANRQDLVDQEMAKVKIMESYLPAAMSDEELLGIVKKVVEKSNVKNMSSIMKVVMAEVGSGADGGRVAAAVREELTQS